MKRKEVVGYDLGGTIYKRANGELLLDRGALRVIRRLTTEKFGINSHIISKVNEEQKLRAIEAMREEDLCGITGIPRENVEFCEERHQKAALAERIGITHFIDDRPEVLIPMTSVPFRFLIRGSAEDLEMFGDKLEGIIRVQSWAEIEAYMFP